MPFVQSSVFKEIVVDEDMKFYMESLKILTKEELPLDKQAELEATGESYQRQAHHLLREFEPFTSQYQRENSMIFQYFPLEELEIAQQCEFLKHIITEKGGEGSIGNKMISNLKKISFDLSDRRFDKLWLEEENLSPLVLNEKKINEAFRLKIKKLPQSDKEFRETKESFSEIVENYCRNTARYEDVHSLYSLSRIILEQIFQMLFYWVQENPQLSEEEKRNAYGKIEEKIDKILDSQKNIKRETPLSYPQVIVIFQTFLKHRSSMEQHKNLDQILQIEEENKPELFQEVEEKYRVKKHFKITDQKKLHVFLYEGRRKGKVYEAQRDMTYRMICLMQKERELQADCMQDVKVLFRELFISKVTTEKEYGVTANTLAKKYLKDPKSLSMDERKFLHEKINRGFFRERHSLALYHQQNRLKHKIHLSMVQSFLSYDLTEICQTLNLLFSTTLEACHNVFSENFSETEPCP